MIDVLLPYYGDPALMRIAVHSVRGQTHGDWRLLVIDDCYPELWLQPWLQEFQDSRITYLRHRENQGANATYAEALSLATSDYVMFMGADDRCLPKFLARVDQMIQRFDGPEIIQPGVDVIDEQGAIWSPVVDRIKSRLAPSLSEPRSLGGEGLAASVLRGNWTYFPSLVWSRVAIQAIGFRPFHVVQDLGLLVDVVRSGGRMVVDPQVTFQYRRHAGSDSSVKTLGGARFQEEADYCSMIAAELQADGWQRASRAARLRLTSRLHALSLLPTAMSRRDVRAVKTLVRHVAR